MIFSEMKDLIRNQMSGRYDQDLPPDSVIRQAVHRALKRIAKETVPLRLVTNDPSQLTVIRKIDNDTYIRFPLMPYRDDDDIDIDEELVEAVAAHVCSELEPQRKGHYLSVYEREIVLNNERLIETDLDTFSNETSTRRMAWV
jgi:hypothetical protein